MEKQQYYKSNRMLEQKELQQFLIPRNNYKDGMISGRRKFSIHVAEQVKDGDFDLMIQQNQGDGQDQYFLAQNYYKNANDYQLSQPMAHSQYRAHSNNTAQSPIGSTISGDIGGTSSMRFSRLKIDQMKSQNTIRDNKKSGRNIQREVSPQYYYNQDPKRQYLSAFHLMSKRKTSPDFKSDLDSKSAAPSYKQSSRKQIVIQSNDDWNNKFLSTAVRENPTESYNSTESQENQYRASSKQNEIQILTIQRSQLIARNHIFLNTFFQMIAVGLLIFMIFYGNWTCRSFNENDSTQICFSLFQMKIYNHQESLYIKDYYMGNQRGNIVRSESFADCIQNPMNDNLKGSCKRYLWGGLGYVIINTLGILLNTYSIFCSLAIVMIWNIPFKQSSKKFIIAGNIVNCTALLYWFCFQWTDKQATSLSPCPIMVIITLFGTFLIMMHYHFYINKIVQSRRVQTYLESNQS